MARNKPICYAPNCNAEGRVKGLCRKHYKRLWAYGRLEKVKPSGKAAKALLDAVLREDIKSDDCILWIGYVSRRGYPRYNDQQVHRIVLQHFAGPCPTGLEACHSCGNSTCINPSHLRWDKHSNNIADKTSHGTQPVGQNNPSAKLKPADVLTIRSSSLTVSELAQHFGVTPNNVRRILKRETWTHL